MTDMSLPGTHELSHDVGATTCGISTAPMVSFCEFRSSEAKPVPRFLANLSTQNKSLAAKNCSCWASRC